MLMLLISLELRFLSKFIAFWVIKANELQKADEDLKYPRYSG